MGFAPYYFIGRARGKDVFMSIHASGRIRERGIGEREVIDALRRPWKRLRDAHPATLPGFKRYVYVSKKHRLIVVAEEDSMIIVVTLWRRVRDIEEYVEERVSRGVWIE